MLIWRKNFLEKIAEEKKSLEKNKQTNPLKLLMKRCENKGKRQAIRMRVRSPHLKYLIIVSY